MIHVMRGEECETCEGDYLTALGPQAAPEEPPSDSYLKLSHPPMNGPMPECEICSGEHPDGVRLAKD
jgi:hypothetical protein